MAGKSRQPASAPGRERILDAAYKLFLEHQYPHVTLREIAEEAGVAPQTVYYFFGSKAVLGAATQGRTIAGGTVLTSWRNAPWAADLLAATTAHDLITAFVAADTAIKGRIAAWSVAVGRYLPPESLGFDRPGRDEFFAFLIERIDEFGELRRDRPHSDLLTTIKLINSVGAYVEATRTHHWSDDQWRNWLIDVFERTLLAR